MPSAFILGAGLGTRLRPLTEHLPKPLVPLWNKPLVEYTFDLLIHSGFDRFIVNTHHCPEAWNQRYVHPDAPREPALYRGNPVFFRQEPILLETAGGLKNIEDLVMDGEDLLIFNGDVLADLPLSPLMETHRRDGNLVTLLLRSCGGPLHVQADPAEARVLDIRNTIGSAPQAPSFLFSGISVVSPEIFRWIPAGEILSLIPVFLEILRKGRRIGAHICEEGMWRDLGTRDAYLDAHRELLERPLSFQRAVAGGVDGRWQSSPPQIKGFVCMGNHCAVGSDVVLEDTVIWEGAEIASRSTLRRCIVRSKKRADGVFENQDF